jgi:hypothetical protein
MNERLLNGAFVLQLGPATDFAAGRLEGRIEHLASMRSARFASVAELLTLLRDLTAEAARSRRPADSTT